MDIISKNNISHYIYLFLNKVKDYMLDIGITINIMEL